MPAVQRGRNTRTEPGQRNTPAPTIFDVAKDAEVSAMTVSRVLNNTARVSPESRRKVERSVAKLGYRRNENARSIRPGQKSGLVGVIITNIENPYYAHVLLGVEDALDTAGMRVLVGMSHGDIAREARLVEDFTGRQVEGLIVVPAGTPAAHLKPARLRGTPLVFASRANPGIDADTVVIDDLEGATQGTKHLLDQGHRRIAFLGNRPTVSTAQRRFEGFSNAHRSAGVAVDDALVVRTCRDFESSSEAVNHLLELPDPPTAIFSANNQVTMGILEPLVRRTRVAGSEPIPIAAIDDFPLSNLVNYPIVFVDHDARGLGRTAANLMIQRLNSADDTTPPLRVSLPTSLRIAHPTSP